LNNCETKLNWDRARYSMESKFYIDNLLFWICLVIVMVERTGLTPWEFEYLFPGSLISSISGVPSKKEAYSNLLCRN